ncbi:MAG TPA: putative S-layer protein [Candidatus Pacearchaeota archaeon]|nr:putative S-layer protein [Candidatus Pacearchaeota archaeon]
MKSKFTLFTLSIFAILLFAGVASAALTFGTPTIPTSVDHEAGSFDIVFNLTNDAAAVDPINWASTVTSGATLAFNVDAIADGSVTDVTEEITATITFPNTVGENVTGEINITGESGIISFSVKTTPEEITSCNDLGNLGRLRIKGIDFTNEGLPFASFGNDDDWFLFEEIEVEIDVKNDGSFDVDDVEISWGLYDVSAGEWAIDFDEEDEVNIKDGNTETFTVSFKVDDDFDVDLEDLSDDTDNYRLYVVAEGTIDDNDSLDDGEKTCAFDYEPATIIIENDFIVIGEVEMPEKVQCGETVTVTADVWNVGSDQQDEVVIEFFDRGNALGIGENIEVGDIDEFDNQEVSFTFKVPKDAEEKSYQLIFEISDEDGDVYENDFDDDESRFIVPFKVEDCSAPVPDLTISAALDSEAKAGEKVVVRSTITNNEDGLRTFTISAAGFASWASSVEVSQTALALQEGESRVVTFTFEALEDASGTQTFFIEALSGDEVTRQPVSVLIEPRAGGLFGGDNLPLAIGVLNVVLVIIIIFVAVRVARR